jgi:hypothetical protein
VCDGRVETQNPEWQQPQAHGAHLLQQLVPQVLGPELVVRHDARGHIGLEGALDMWLFSEDLMHHCRRQLHFHRV